MSHQLKIIIADDHPMFRSGLRQSIEAEPRFKIVAEASDGKTALDLIEREQPDIVILDVNMPEKDGFAVARELQRRQTACEIVFLTMHGEEAMFRKALDLGAKGYLLKDSAAIEIVNCLLAVSKGEYCASPAMTTFLFKSARHNASPKRATDELTPTERIVLRLIAENKTSKEIAEELSVSYRTVENHRYNICQKLDISGSNALLRYALQHRNEI
jgi:DNA-binding NarL/FixJ family response regulator